MKAPSSNARAGFLLVLLAAVFTYGLIRVFSIRFATGDVYPDYSSMKATPAGAKLLYDSLSRTPGISTVRNYAPQEYSDENHAAYLFLGVDLNAFIAGPQAYFEPLEKLAGRGNRVVVALDRDGDQKPPSLEPLEKRWQVKLQLDPGDKRLYIADAPGWKVLARANSRILAIERAFPKGSVVLFSESRIFSNGSVEKTDRLAEISDAIGDKTRVVFDERHFGISESGTVVGLAQHFRLMGMAAGLAVCAALFIWKNAAGFPPPAVTAHRDTLTGRTSLSGLNTLLHRHVKPADLAATCWNEWLVGNGRNVSPERRVRAEAILRQRGGEPLTAAREIQIVLHAKGPL